MTRTPDERLRAVLDVLEEFATWLGEVAERVAAVEIEIGRLTEREDLRTDADALMLALEVHPTDLGCPPVGPSK